jgi:hypothetical protein
VLWRTGLLVDGIADRWLVRHFSKTTRPSRSTSFVYFVYFVVRLTASLRLRLQTRHGSGEWGSSVREARARSALDRVDIRLADAKGMGMGATQRFPGWFSPSGWQFYGTRVGQGCYKGNTSAGPGEGQVFRGEVHLEGLFDRETGPAGRAGHGAGYPGLPARLPCVPCRGKKSEKKL